MPQPDGPRQADLLPTAHNEVHTLDSTHDPLVGLVVESQSTGFEYGRITKIARSSSGHA